MGISAVLDKCFDGDIAHTCISLTEDSHFLCHKLGIGLENVAAVKEHIAAFGTEISAHSPNKRGLSAAVGSDYGIHLSPVYIKAYAVKDTAVPVTCTEIFYR